MNSAVATFLAGEDVSDGASGSDEAEAARPHPHVRPTAEDVRLRQEINSADAVYYPDDDGYYPDDDLWRPCQSHHFSGSHGCFLAETSFQFQ